MNNYVFHMNLNPITREETIEYIEIKIPETDEDAARETLRELVGSVLARKFRLDDIQDY